MWRPTSMSLAKLHFQRARARGLLRQWATIRRCRMMRKVGALSLLALSTLGCAQRTVRVESVSSGSLAPVVMPVNARMLPTGSDVYVQLDHRIDTRSGRTGDMFSATVRHPVYAMNGARVIPSGAKVYGRVLDLD